MLVVVLGEPRLVWDSLTPPSLGPSDGAPPRKEKRARIDTSKKIAMKEGARSQGGEGSWTHVSALADSDTDEGPPRQPLWGRRQFPPKYLDPRRGWTFTLRRPSGRGSFLCEDGEKVSRGPPPLGVVRCQGGRVT